VLLQTHLRVLGHENHRVALLPMVLLREAVLTVLAGGAH